MAANQLISSKETCWVCEQKFVQYGGTDSSLVQNFHHIIPRAYGGEKGPVVSLCSAHHDLLHLIALRLIKCKQYFDLMTNDPVKDQRLLWLATRVQKAEAAVRNDPNKRMMLPLVLDGATNQRLIRLAKVSKVSRGRLITLLIEREYSKMFPS